MTGKTILKALLGIHEGRMRDNEIMDLSLRFLNTRVNLQGRLLGLLAVLIQSRFAGADEELAEILATIQADAAISEEMKRQANLSLMHRDQLDAEIATLKSQIDGLPDD